MNNILLEHSHAHSFKCCLYLFCIIKAALSKYYRLWLTKHKIFTTWLLTEKVCQLFCRICISSLYLPGFICTCIFFLMAKFYFASHNQFFVFIFSSGHCLGWLPQFVSEALESLVWMFVHLEKKIHEGTGMKLLLLSCPDLCSFIPDIVIRGLYWHFTSAKCFITCSFRS